MSEIKLFQLAGGRATEIAGSASDLEKPLQNLIERNLEPLLGIRFLASEFSTGKTHAGRIDTLVESLEGYVLSLGDDVQRKQLKPYVAYKRIRNFVSVVVQKDRLVLYLRLDPTKVELAEGFTRDVRSIGHWATGDLEVTVGGVDDFERAKPLIRQAYEGGSGAR